MRDAVDEFKTFNRPFAQRSAELMQFKIARMADSPFAFFRGTFHLFARDFLDHGMNSLPVPASDSVEIGLVGDIHSENYGTYKAEDGIIHYDINDFDETTTGRFDFDVCRFAVNIVLASQERHDSLEDQTKAVLSGLGSYLQTLQTNFKNGKFVDLDYSEKTPGDVPAISQLLAEKALAKRSHFISELAEDRGGSRLIKRSLRKYFNLRDEEKSQALRLLLDFQERHPQKGFKNFFDIQDVCGRISGIGSMGRYRYVVLVSGKGHEEKRDVLLEFKESRPSAYDTYRNRETSAQALVKRAEKVIAYQRQSQAASSPLLGHAIDGEFSFQVREISPYADRLDCKSLKSAAQFGDVMRVQGAILARTHARSFARSEGPSSLPELADPQRFQQRMLTFALGYADVVFQDWSRFTAARPELDDVGRWSA